MKNRICLSLCSLLALSHAFAGNDNPYTRNAYKRLPVSRPVRSARIQLPLPTSDAEAKKISAAFTDYLELTGGTLTGTLYGTTGSFNTALGVGTTSPTTYGAFAVRKYVSVGGVNTSGHFSDAVNNSFYIQHNSSNVVLHSDAGLVLQSGSQVAISIESTAGKVGIGNTSPIRTLDVFSSTSPGITIGGSAANTVDRNLVFSNASNAVASVISVIPNTVGTNSLMQFYVGGAAGSDVKMVINDDGKIGIGTTSPSQKLSVDGNVLSTGNIIASGILSSAGAIISGSGAAEVDRNLVFANASNSIAGLLSVIPNTIGTNSLMQFYVGGASTGDVKMVIDDDGKIGVGTTTPSEKLTVIGNIGTTGNVNAGGILYSSGSIIGGSAANHVDRNLVFKNASDNVAGLVSVIPNTIGTNSLMQFYVGGGSGSDVKMSINDDGNIGIGTTPESGNKLAVKGNIRTQKLIVENAGWADYVFADDYKLRSLAAVGAFIKQNKHLPEVPSAAEVAKTGISVGDNQTLLLKKIEELTLYLLQQEEKIKEMNKKIKMLSGKKH